MVLIRNCENCFSFSEKNAFPVKYKQFVPYIYHSFWYRIHSLTVSFRTRGVYMLKMQKSGNLVNNIAFA